MISPSASGRPDFDDSEERHFDAMGRQQCLDLIESHHLGRIAWQAADLPQILPITYAMHQVDALDQQTRTGWSIVLHGHSSAVREPDELADMWASDSLVPWASGNRTLFIRIRPDRIEGRVVRRPT